MRYPIVALCGQAGSGKSSVAHHIKTVLGRDKVAEISFADPLKEIVKEIIPETDDEILWGSSERRNERIPFDSYEFWEKIRIAHHSYGAPYYNLIRDTRSWMYLEKVEKKEQITYRELLQALGDAGRRQDEMIWVNEALNRARQRLCDGYNLVVISDARYRNEILAVKELGGIVWKIQRPGHSSNMTHSSETELIGVPSFWFDATISETIQNLRSRVSNELRRTYTANDA